MVKRRPADQVINGVCMRWCSGHKKMCPASQFACLRKAQGTLQPQCKIITTERNKAQWANRDREKTLKRKQAWRNSNRARIRSKMNKWRKESGYNKIEYQRRKNDPNHIAYNASYRRKYERDRRKNDPEWALKQNASRRIREMLSDGVKKERTTTYLGCSISVLKIHLESQFEEGMTWDNRSEWHIDHRRPCASFDLMDEEQQKMCFHYTNLQPMWAIDNITKGDKYNEETFSHVWTGERWESKPPTP